jgi:hypothetical protein
MRGENLEALLSGTELCRDEEVPRKNVGVFM